MNGPTKRPLQILCWSDSCIATTGFGVVSKNILEALYKTGLYEIDQLAINYFGDFYDKEQVPYCLVPAKLGNPNDPYGNQMLLQSLYKKDYDYLFIINDTFVVEGVADGVEEIRQKKIQEGKKPFSIIYYFPVDCRVLPTASKMIKIADRAVAYTQFAADEAKRIGLKSTDIIHHGVDIDLYHPLSSKEKTAYRKQYLGVGDDTFVLINVNRNSLRKDMPRTLLAFSEFRKKVPNSLLYMHTKVEDGFGGYNIDLKVPLEELGLSMRKDVIFPNSYNPAKGFPPKILNQLYNCADAFITTHLGEGFGLTIIESMAAGTPVIVPDNTVMPEIVGNGKGYIYPCKEKTYIDNSGYRAIGHIDDIVDTMYKAYVDWKDPTINRNSIIAAAKSFAIEHSWKDICKSWVALFATTRYAPTTSSFRGEKV
jgi:glycosyltransferase involved in cell wall biosynthesis